MATSTQYKSSGAAPTAQTTSRYEGLTHAALLARAHEVRALYLLREKQGRFRKLRKLRKLGKLGW